MANKIEMKKIVCLLAITLTFVFHSHAQKTGTETITFDFSKADTAAATTNGTVIVIGHERNKAFYEKKLKQAKKKKIVGIVLSSLGAATLGGTIGGYFAIKNKNRTSGYSAFRDQGFLLQVGIPASAVFLGVGIPLSIVGSKLEKKYNKKLAAY